MGVLNCARSSKQLIIEQNGQKLWNSRSYVLHKQGTSHVRFFDFSLGLFGAFAKFPMLRSSKGHQFSHSISTKLSFKLYCKYVCQEGIWAITFLAICPNLKILWHFDIFVNTGPYQAGNFKRLLLLQIFVLSNPNFMINKASISSEPNLMI